MTPWPPSRMAQLAELWRAGMPIPEIAQRLSVTYDSVVGEAHRMGLGPHPRGKGRKPILAYAQTGGHERGCRSPLWPHHANPTHEYCCAKTGPGEPYCAAHRAICWTPQKMAKGDAA